MTHARNDGGKTDYYDVPKAAETLNDLIECKGMPFALGVIFKAAYRFGDPRTSSTKRRDLNKIIYYANRLLAQLEDGDA